MFVCMYVRKYVCTYVCVYVFMYVRMHILRICVFMYVCTYVCMCLFVHPYVVSFQLGIAIMPLNFTVTPYVTMKCSNKKRANTRT
jgi:hypothetical protein